MTTMKFSELPAEVKAYFDVNEELFESVRSELENPTQFEAAYAPTEIQLLFDDVVCGIIDTTNPEEGLRPIRSPLSDNPETMEVLFDNRTAILIIRGHEVINRLDNMYEFDSRTNLSFSKK